MNTATHKTVKKAVKGLNRPASVVEVLFPVVLTLACEAVDAAEVEVA